MLSTNLLKTFTVNEIGGGSARHPEGSINAGFNLRHKVGDGTLFDVILLIVFDPEISGEQEIKREVKI